MKKEYDLQGGRRWPVVSSPGKTRVTMYLYDDVIEEFRALGDAGGQGYQTLINAALREYLESRVRP